MLAVLPLLLPFLVPLVTSAAVQYERRKCFAAPVLRLIIAFTVRAMSFQV
jgi:hypothetical protein